MLAGAILTVIGTGGMALALTGPPGSRPSPWWFAPLYMIGSLLLIGGGIRWLLSVMGRPH